MKIQLWAAIDSIGGYDIGTENLELAKVKPRKALLSSRCPADYDHRALAMLFKAAPDLLAALEALTDEAFINMRGGKGHLIDDARAAIAKAKG